jgi:L-ascorbate metabolism protein UlaG (beta-lactamase superfamily)
VHHCAILKARIESNARYFLLQKSLITLLLLAIAVLSLMSAATTHADTTAHRTQLEWYGHSAFKLTTPSGAVLLIDPWITNPTNPTGKEDVASLTHVDYILITHGHFDHVGDADQIATQSGAKLVTTFDLGNALTSYGGYPAAQGGMATEGNFGGTISLAGGEVAVTFIPAIHSSTVTPPPGSADMSVHEGGNPGGFLITVKNGPTIYDTGDTDEFGDMALIPKLHKVDVMIACIGDHFTMGPARAADAVRLVGPRIVIPQHYGTFPVLTGTPAEFSAALKAEGLPVKLDVMHVHQTLTF